MKKYNIEKQSVYNKKSALNKKIMEAGLFVEDILNNTATKAAEKKAIQKRGRKPELQEKQEEPIRDIVRFEKNEYLPLKPLSLPPVVS